MFRHWILLIVFMTILFTGCNKGLDEVNINQNSETVIEQETNKQEIIFKNQTNKGANENSWLPLFSSYRVDNNETLYAFSINVMGYNSETGSSWPENFPNLEDYNDEKEYSLDLSIAWYDAISELMLKEGLIVIPECSYYLFDEQNEILNMDTGWSTCIVAGTQEDILAVFSKNNFVNSDPELDGGQGYFIVENWYLIVEEALRPDYIDIVCEAGWDKNETKYSEWISTNRDKVATILGSEDIIALTVPVIIDDGQKK